jgi:hypothetical protein
MKQEKTAEAPVQPQVATSIVAKKRHSPTSQVVVNQQQGVSVKDNWESAPKRKAAKLDTKDVK